MHYSVLVAVDGSVKEADVEKEVARLLEPFNEHTEVEPYAIDPAVQKWHDTWEESLAKAKKWHAENQQKALAGKGEPWFSPRVEDEWTDLQYLNWYGGEDENSGPWVEDGNGGYVEMSTYNPLSKWDYWIIGGRWDGYLNQVPNGHDEHPVWGKTPLYKDGKNVIRRRDLRRPQSTYAYLTKEGEWVEKPDADVDWSDRDAANSRLGEVQAEWDKAVAEYLLKVPGEDWLVVVDIHI